MRSSKDALRDAGLVNHNGIEAIRAVRGKEVNKPVLHRFRTRKLGERVLLITDTAYPAMLRCCDASANPPYGCGREAMALLATGPAWPLWGPDEQHALGRI